MLKRTIPAAPPSMAFANSESDVLKHLNHTKRQGDSKPSVSDYVLQVAKLGGYLARANDPPPGNIVIWRGMSRLTDIQLGLSLRGKTYG